MSQDQVYATIFREKPGPKNRTAVLGEPAKSKCTWPCHKSNFTREFAETKPSPRTGPPFRASLRSRSAHFMREFTRKKPGVKSGDNRGLCASLGSRNAYAHGKKLRLCENLQQIQFARGWGRTLIEPRPTVRTPQALSVAALFGEKMEERVQ